VHAAVLTAVPAETGCRRRLVHTGAQESARGEDDDNNRGGQLAQQLDAGDRPSAARSIQAALVVGEFGTI